MSKERSKLSSQEEDSLALMEIGFKQSRGKRTKATPMPAGKADAPLGIDEDANEIPSDANP